MVSVGPLPQAPLLGQAEGGHSVGMAWLRGTVYLGMGLASLWLPVGVNPGSLLLTLFCMRFPWLGRAMVGVELPAGRLACPQRCRAPCCSELSQSPPAAGLCLVGAGRGAWCCEGWQAGAWGGQSRLQCSCTHCRGERLDLAPVPWGRQGAGQWVHGRGLRVMEQPLPQPLFAAQGGLWLLEWSLCCHGHSACVPAGNSCLSVCPPRWAGGGSRGGRFVVWGLPRSAGIHRVTQGAEDQTRGSAAGRQGPFQGWGAGQSLACSPAPPPHPLAAGLTRARAG